MSARLLRYETSVYEGCGDYTNVDIEAETPEAFAAEIARIEAGSVRFVYDSDKVYVQTAPTSPDLAAIARLLEPARAEYARQVAERKAADERRTQQQRRSGSAALLRDELERLRADLTPEAIKRRERRIADLSRPEPGEPA